MPYVDADDLPEVRVPPPFSRSLKVVMAPETDDEVKSFTLIYSTLSPYGGCTDIHSHDGSGELMVVVSGEGRALLAGEECVLKPGVAVFAPPGVEHRTMNTGAEPLRIVCVFIPPAPADYVRHMVRAAEVQKE